MNRPNLAGFKSTPDKILAESSKNDYSEGRWDNYDAYVLKYNEILRKLNKLGSCKEWPIIENVPNGETSYWKKGVPAEREKLKEVSLKSEELLVQLKSDLEKSEQDEKTRSAGDIEAPDRKKTGVLEVDFVRMDDGWHWVVNGMERKRIADRKSRKIRIAKCCLTTWTLVDSCHPRDFAMR